VGLAPNRNEGLNTSQGNTNRTLEHSPKVELTDKTNGRFFVNIGGKPGGERAPRGRVKAFRGLFPWGRRKEGGGSKEAIGREAWEGKIGR